MRHLTTLALAGLLVLAGCGDLGPFSHHRPDHVTDPEHCPPGHERRGLCTTDPVEPDPEPVPVVVDSVWIDPPDMTVQKGQSVGFQVVLWEAGAPHFCVILDGQSGLLEVRQDTDGWHWADGAALIPFDCGQVKVTAADPSLVDVTWSPHVIDSSTALGSGAIPASGWRSA